MSDQPGITTTSGGVTLNATTINITGDVTGRDKLTSGAPVTTPTLRATPPRPPDHFTGREADLEKFTHLLTSGQSVAITALHGLGGIGKTSLAQKLAEQIAAQFPGGVLWWTLGPNPDVITALDVWARHADPRADLTALPTAEARAEAVRPMLAQLGKLCDIIDDVWDAESFNVLRSAVPAGCPLLMTTRDADLAKTLRCRVERIDALSDDEAVDLLVKLLGPLDDNEDAACDIAHLTEGLPLALELIAGLADSPADLPALAKRLRERSPLDVLKRGITREQSIETCFTLSYDHLDADLQRRFCALGVFALAPFDRDAIAAVWAEEGDAVDQSISQLVRRSLLSKVDGTAEYRQHALLHDYALKLLKANNPHPSPPPSNKSSSTGEGTATPSPVRGSNAIDKNATSDQQTGERSKTSDASAEARDGGSIFAARHADHYRTFAKTQDWRAIEHAFDQIEHGWQWVQQNAPEQIINYVVVVRGFLRTRGRQVERMRWLNAGLQQAQRAHDRKAEGGLLNSIALAYNALGQQDKALDTYQQALAIRREVGDRPGEGTTLNNVGLIYKTRGQLTEALNTYQQALTIRREVGDHSGEGTTLNNLGAIYDALGQKDKALDTYQQALAIRREVGDRSGEGTTLSNIGEVYRTLGLQDKALATFQQALTILREVGNRSMEGIILNNIGLVYYARSQLEKAIEYFDQAVAILREVGDRWTESMLLSNIGTLFDKMGGAAEAVTYLEQCVALMTELGHPDLEANRAVLERVRAKLRSNG